MTWDPDAVAFLVRAVPELRALAAPEGALKIRDRSPGFESLAKVVVEQAVSQASAHAVWARAVADGPVTPHRWATLDPARLQHWGLSRAKAECLAGLAAAACDGRLNLDEFVAQSDEEVRASLCRFRGVGPWTANIYLLSALRRPDVWPSRDLAIQEALKTLFELPERPSWREAEALSQPMRPYRSTAARMLWEEYLRRPVVTATPKRKPSLLGRR